MPLLISKRPLRDFFMDEKRLWVKENWWVILLFAVTILSPFFMYFLPRFSSTPPLVLLLSVPLALVHAFFEELFWRGLYIKEFPDSVVWGVVIPSLFFSLWHVAPQFAIPADDVVLFVASTLPLGFVYGFVAYATKSARWSAIGHGISGVMAYSGFLSLSLSRVLTQ
ncbi:CPBP family intramembrane glutamic endopeptidase [Spirochaeta thermophila]|nr:CPBP family intramembrane glutamic endopeptidase [Spirochaeta thermophila]